MRTTFLFCFCWLLAPLLNLQAAAPLSPGPDIESVTGLVQWGPLLQTLAAKNALYATFTEQRWFPFKKQPTVLEGEMRYSNELGLSLCYTHPDIRMVILDAQGILMRDGKGRERKASTDARVPEFTHTLLSIMQFDLEALRSTFVIRGNREGEEWRIDLEPRTKELARNLGWVALFGSGTQVHRLEFKRAENQRIEILIRQSRDLEGFGAVERKRYFRN